MEAFGKSIYEKETKSNSNNSRKGGEHIRRATGHLASLSNMQELHYVMINAKEREKGEPVKSAGRLGGDKCCSKHYRNTRGCGGKMDG